MEIRLAILPPPKVSKMAGELGRIYGAKFPSWFKVDNRILAPHITLFVLNIKPKDIAKLKSSAAKQVKFLKKFGLTISRHSVYPGGWTGLKIKDSKRLSVLRKTLFNALKSFDSLQPVKLKPKFSPHITLTKFKSPNNSRKAIKNSKILIRNFSAEVVAICLSNKHSQVTKALRIFKFK